MVNRVWQRLMGRGLVANLSDYPVPQNAGEFRLTSRRVLDALARYYLDVQLFGKDDPRRLEFETIERDLRSKRGRANTAAAAE